MATSSQQHWTSTVTLADLVKNKGDVVYVTPRTSIQATAKLLKKKNFLSVPVWDEERREFVGIIDVIDLVTFAVLVLNIQCHHHNVKEISNEELQKLTFANGTVEDILSLPGAERRRMYVFQSHVKVANAMKILGHHESRVLVMHGTREQLFTMHKVIRYRMLTQTDVIAYLVKNFLKLDVNVIHKKIGDLNLVNPELIKELSITIEDRAIDGFFKMLEQELSACPVVDKDGVLVTNLSASDLRGVTSENLQEIALPVLSFIPHFTGKNYHAPITCTVNDTLDTVMTATVKNKVHQVWIVDAQKRPVGVVTMSDMILTSLGCAPGSHDVVKGRVEHFFDTLPHVHKEG